MASPCQAECAIDINLKQAEIGGKPDVCLDATSNNLRFTAENGVNINVEGLIVNIIGTQKAETNDLPDGKIPKAGTYIGIVPWNKAEGGDIRQVKITPKVILFEEEEICTEKALIFETVNPCQIYMMLKSLNSPLCFSQRSLTF